MAATPGSKIALTGWNAYSRIDAVTGLASPYLARLYIDSDAWTNIQRWDGRVESLAPMREWYRALPFHLVERPRTLVIGPGATYEMTALEPLLPCHTCQLRPPMVVVPTTEPIGWMLPWRLNQIMISMALTPLVRGVGSSQMSYEAL